MTKKKISLSGKQFESKNGNGFISHDVCNPNTTQHTSIKGLLFLPLAGSKSNPKTPKFEKFKNNAYINRLNDKLNTQSFMKQISKKTDQT